MQVMWVMSVIEICNYQCHPYLMLKRSNVVFLQNYFWYIVPNFSNILETISKIVVYGKNTSYSKGI